MLRRARWVPQCGVVVAGGWGQDTPVPVPRHFRRRKPRAVQADRSCQNDVLAHRVRRRPATAAPLRLLQ